MTTPNTLERKRNEEGQIKACLVSDHKGLEGIQSLFVDTAVLVKLRKRLLDLLKDRDCSLYIVDTGVKDMDVWPAPLFAISDARSREWWFLLSRLSDAVRLQPLPQNARLIDRKGLSAEKIASLIKAQLDPESRKRFARVRYSEDLRSFIVEMGNGRTYDLRVSELPEADSTKIAKWSLSRHRDYIKVTQESGSTFEIPWDDVLYHCEPQYEFYKGKRANTESDASRIGERVRTARKLKGYSVRMLADKAGMKRPNLSRLEHGRHQPALETLERIAQALEISIAELVAG